VSDQARINECAYPQGKPVEHTVAVRFAAAALRFIADEPDLVKRFRLRILADDRQMSLSASRENTERLTPDVLQAIEGVFVEAMIRDGYQ
jgi:hypothetical protein